jgi:7,8-dihydro-6-hydroxymethylpterin dimethyltransferase
MACCNLTPEQIRAWEPYQLHNDGLSPMQRAQERLKEAGQWLPWQNMGRRWAIGCVSLEITQRCNLDCTLCYLSEASEAIKDVPMAELYRRVDMILEHYGPNTDIQISGGDPTLRKREELVEITRYIRSKGMRSTLFTNGILAKRDMLEELVAAGLTDVAFHVDMTQERKGYASEAELNEIRLDYIERARGLPIGVFFNTTVYDGNVHEVPMLAEFFVQHCDVVKLASFQLQADTGRGVIGSRRMPINPESIGALICQGARADLMLDTPAAGHRDCNRAAVGVVINGRMYDLFRDKAFLADILERTRDLEYDRRSKPRMLAQIGRWLLKNPRTTMRVLGWAFRHLWAMRRDLIAARGKVHKLGFFIHNFMDAEHLECDRIESCAFMVATQNGPISMCLHNAKRDSFVLQPLAVQEQSKLMYWNPLTGRLEDQKPEKIELTLTRKNARGRAKQELEARRAKTQQPA